MVRYGTSPTNLDRMVSGPSDTAYHYVEVTGLQPGVTYYYQARSGGMAVLPRLVPVLDYSALRNVTNVDQASPAQLQALVAQLLSPGQTINAAPGSVTTLVPPPGALLFTIALSNDLHIGETQSGLITVGYPPSFSQAPGEAPYPIVMGASLIADAGRRGASVLVVAGDLTSAAHTSELTAARQLLDGFGPLTLSGQLPSPSYVVARGNHDQPKTGTDYQACTQVSPGYYDCLPAVFPLPQGKLTSTEHAGLRLIGLDTTTLNQAGGAIDPAQFAELSTLLAANPAQPTLVFGHHPVTEESALTTFSGPTFDLDRSNATVLETLYAGTPGVFFHHAGHTHRNKRTSSPLATGVEFLEVAAIKEYPGGFTLLRFYEGGYMVNFYKSSSAQAREWSQTSSGEYLGLYPAYTLGGASERNHVVARAFPTLGQPSTSLPEFGLPVALPAAAAALGGAALVARSRCPHPTSVGQDLEA
ncbi:MAG: metallophosphoesterase family protein [Candidatus Dormibacteraeota bacterium]|uniref:Metallophosphoesterase family protein n=1 Tax=Candidatus Amunia macphersoniae TaxID=3127014 RepID=A0A934NIW8_9BACT|nr:metallophosphoesterase family protein [Candidatus Dormibacteraeota bacterium]